ncbi:MAG: hypothetical protein HOV83_26395 [Catenulispora sp.]|nr:hypothetical protein [Catenulispora sp.]
MASLDANVEDEGMRTAPSPPSARPDMSSGDLSWTSPPQRWSQQAGARCST